MAYRDLTPNQTRVQIDARQAYEAFLDAKRVLAGYTGGMKWKKVGGREYLIKVVNRTGSERSLGPRTPAMESLFDEWKAGKARAQERSDALAATVREFAGMSVGVGINRVPSVVTSALRRLDEHGLLGKNIMVIGTNAMYAYEAAASVMFDAGLMATTDVDFLWD